MLFFRTKRLQLIESQYLRGQCGRELWKSSCPHIPSTTLSLRIQAGSAVAGCPGWSCSWCAPGHGWPSCLQGPCWHNIQLCIDQDPQIFFCGTASQHLTPQSVCTSRVSPSQVQNLALSIVENCHSSPLPLGLSLGPAEKTLALSSSFLSIR